MSALAPVVSTNDKSTIVRPNYTSVPPILHRAFRLGSRLAPAVTSSIAERLFYRPHHRFKHAAGAPAQRRLSLGGQQIAVHLWGEGGPAVLLVHGWAGSGAQMAPLAWALAADGYRVIAVDLPAHGKSSGTSTNLQEVAELLCGVVREAGPVFAAVGHSFGAVATVVVAGELQLTRVVTVGSPATLRFVIDSYTTALGVEGGARARLHARLERRFGADFWERYSPRRLVQSLDTPALIIHDVDDTAVPHDEAVALAAAWRQARTFTTSQLGHYRVLRSPDAHAAIRSFLHHGDTP